MIEITDLMGHLLRNALADGTPCLVGTASKDGHPQISPKGSVAVFDKETLSFWERSFRGAYQHILENPNIVIYYRNQARQSEVPFRGGALRFRGQARVAQDGPERERAWNAMAEAERERDPKKSGVAILVRIDLIEELSGAIVMMRD